MQRVIAIPGDTLCIAEQKTSLYAQIVVNGSFLPLKLTKDYLSVAKETNHGKEYFVLLPEFILLLDGDLFKDPEVYCQENSIAKIKLGADEFYLMGDRRETSDDSRKYGPVKFSEILGKVVTDPEPAMKKK